MSSTNLFREIKLYIKKILDPKEEQESEEDTIESIRKGIDFKGTNLWILIFAVFIASLGLNMNSTAVIIGAMLISPLMGPIMGIGLGVGIYDFELIKKSFRNLLIATIFSVLTSTLYFLISPMSEARSELLARTTPTIYDVLIAFFGGLAGIVASCTKFKGNVIPGVAIATALMPPLCTAGYGLATGNMMYFFGAFYLFTINSVFIAFATTMGVKFMKFSKKSFVDKQKESRVTNIVYLIIFATMIPSLYITYQIIKDNIFENNASKFINQEFDFSNILIINKEIIKKENDKSITVTLLGKEIPEESIKDIENRMEKYGLKNTKLHVLQGFNNRPETIEKNDLNNTILQDYYNHNRTVMNDQESEIHRLKQRLNKYSKIDSLGQTILPEIKILYPDIVNVSISQIIDNDLIENNKDTTTLVIIKYNNQPDNAEEDKFSDWLSARMKVNNLKIIKE